MLLPRARVALLLALLLATAASASPDLESAAVTRAEAVAVTYLSSATVYVDGGTTRGLQVGTRLDVYRTGTRIAEIEVVFVSDHSASCRVTEGTGELRRGDLAVPVGLHLASPSPPGVGTPAATVRAPAPAQPASTPARQGYEPVTPRRPWGRASGSFTLAWREFSDNGSYDHGFGETSGRLSLRLLELGGSDWNVRVRARSRQIDRDRSWNVGNPRSESDDRLYELQAIWTPESGVAELHLGRLGTNPFVSIGYLDGALGQFRLGGRNQLGAFAGARPTLRDLGFQSEGQKYGVFYRFLTPTPGPRLYSEVVVAAIGEYLDGDPSREYVSIETRLRSGGRWHIFERAEVDINRDWREDLTGTTSQLTNLSISGSYRIGRSTRWVASWDQFQRYRDADNRETPEEIFDDYIRQGFRTGVYVNGRRLGGSILLGLRDSQSDRDATASFAGSVRWSPLRKLSFDGYLSYYDGDLASGAMATLAARRRFKGGHDVGLLVGHSTSDVVETDETRTNDWVRLSGRFELPARLFASAEVEALSGDDLDGSRVYVDVGYRF